MADAKHHLQRVAFYGYATGSLSSAWRRPKATCSGEYRELLMGRSSSHFRLDHPTELAFRLAQDPRSRSFIKRGFRFKALNPLIRYIQHCTEMNENPLAYDIVRDLPPRAAGRGFVEAIFEHGAIPEPRPGYHDPINPRDLEPPFPIMSWDPWMRADSTATGG